MYEVLPNNKKPDRRWINKGLQGLQSDIIGVNIQAAQAVHDAETKVIGLHCGRTAGAKRRKRTRTLVMADKLLGGFPIQQRDIGFRSRMFDCPEISRYFLRRLRQIPVMVYVQHLV